MKSVVIGSAVRTPVGRAFKGTLRATRPDEMAAVAIKGALERVPQVDPKEIEDVILGCAMKMVTVFTFVIFLAAFAVWVKPLQPSRM